MELCDKINSDANTCVTTLGCRLLPTNPLTPRTVQTRERRCESAAQETGQWHAKDALAGVDGVLPPPVQSRPTRALTPTVSQALEAAVKNCGRRFHELVAQKEALQAVAKLAANRRSDPEVRDKAASLIQQWADEIRLAPFRDIYSELHSKGVDFPPRDVATMAPVHTPPASVPVQLTDEDAAAIAEAIRQSEAELDEQAAQRARVESATREHVREAMAGGFDFMNARKAEKRLLHHKPDEYMAVPDAYNAPQNVYSPSVTQSQRPAYWGLDQQQPPGSSSQVQKQQQVGSPPAPTVMAASVADPRGQVEMARTTCEVVKEMLGCIDPNRPGEVLTDDVIAQLAATCRGSLAPALQEVCISTSDEGLLADALAVNDEMQRLLEVYNYLVASAKQPGMRAAAAAAQQAGRSTGSPPSSGVAFSSSPPPVLPPKPARLASATPGSVWAGAAAGAPPEEQRLEMRARARSRGAALLAEAGLTLAPPPASKPRTPVGSPPSVSQAGPSSSIDLLTQLDVPAQPQSTAPQGFTNAYSNPSFDASGAGPSSAIMMQPMSSAAACALAQGFSAMNVSAPSPLPPQQSTAGKSGADPFAELLPPVLSTAGASAVPPPPPSMAASRFAVAGPSSMRQPDASTSPPSATNPFL